MTKLEATLGVIITHHFPTGSAIEELTIGATQCLIGCQLCVWETIIHFQTRLLFVWYLILGCIIATFSLQIAFFRIIIYRQFRAHKQTYTFAVLKPSAKHQQLHR